MKTKTAPAKRAAKTARSAPDSIDLSKYTGVPAVVKPKVPMISNRAPFFASSADKPCRVKQIAAGCYGEDAKKYKPWDKTVRAEAKKIEACEASGGHYVGVTHGDLRLAKVELDFLSEAQAKKRGTTPGPNLRLCVKEGEVAPLIPLSDPREAITIRDAFAKCVGNSHAKAQGCARKVAGKGAALGGIRRKRHSV